MPNRRFYDVCSCPRVFVLLYKEFTCRVALPALYRCVMFCSLRELFDVVVVSHACLFYVCCIFFVLMPERLLFVASVNQ